MAAHATTDGLSTLFSTKSWITSGWNMVDDPVGRVANTITAENVQLQYGYNGGWHDLTQTHPVIPVITLKPAIKFSGLGTSTNPYTLTLP